jgi:hypothetical protein
MKKIPQGVTLTAKKVMGKKDYVINDWDLDRIYLTSNGENFTIRMWNVTKEYVDWTFFKDIEHADGSGSGERINDGTYYYVNDIKKGVK